MEKQRRIENGEKQNWNIKFWQTETFELIMLEMLQSSSYYVIKMGCSSSKGTTAVQANAPINGTTIKKPESRPVSQSSSKLFQSQ